MTAAPRFAPASALAGGTETPTAWTPPELLPGDVHELLVLVDSVAQMPGLNRAQREALAGIQSRLSGDGIPPPNVCAALSNWIHALSTGAEPQALNRVAFLVVESAAQAGEFSRWEPLTQAMGHLHELLGSLREGRAEPSLPTPGGACPCGWAFPVAVIPIGTAPAALDTPEDLERARLKSAMVSLRCPTCGTMHGFAMPDAAERLRIAAPERPS